MRNAPSDGAFFLFGLTAALRHAALSLCPDFPYAARMSDPDPPFAVLRFEVTPTTYLDLHHELVRTSPEWTRWLAHRRKVEARWLAAAVAGLVVLVGTLAWAGMGMGTGVGIPPGNLVAALSMIGLCTAGTAYQQWTNSRAARKRYEAGEGMDQSLTAYIAGAWAISCSEGAVTVEMPHQTLRQSWGMFTEVVETPGFVLLRGLDRAGFAVPRAALGEGGADSFIARVRGVLADRGASPRERLRAYFAGHDAACPSCRYALRGTDGWRCPECGAALGLRDFPAAERTPPPQQPASKAATKSP